MASDDVSLPDLEVIARFSLAVRAATAPRAEVVAALEADLRALTGGGGGRARSGGARAVPPAEAPAGRAPAKKAARRAPVKKATATTRPGGDPA